MGEVNETFAFYVSMLEERKAEISRELEQAYSNKQVALTVYSQKAQETVDKIFQVGVVDNLDVGLSTCDLPGDRLRGEVDEAREQRGGVDVQEASGREAPPADRKQPGVESRHCCRARIHLQLSGDTGLYPPRPLSPLPSSIMLKVVSPGWSEKPIWLREVET